MDAQALQLLQKRVATAYAAQGFSAELIGGWAISENDVSDLICAAEKANPHKILEVGTYVGVSTLMLALACPQAEIYTVDPNFELAREMRAVNAKADVAEGAPRHHDIARRTAEALGVASRIHFLEGGFSVGDTFTSLLEDSGARTPVIGPALCADHGPFDFVFIDALHTPDAVEKDLELAAQALAPGATIALHDCIGFWGASVRRGIMAFLRAHPEFHFTHPPFGDVYRSVGIISRGKVDEEVRPVGRPSQALSRTVTAFAKSVFGSTPILEVAIAEPWLDPTDRNVKSVVLPATTAARRKPSAKLAATISGSTNLAIVAIEAPDFASDTILTQLLQSARQDRRPIFMGATPPGESNTAGPFSRPLARLVDLADEAGVSLFLFPFADQEHARYALLPESRELGLSSLMLAFIVAGPEREFIDAAGRRYVRLTSELALDREQEALQKVHLACGYRRYLELARGEQQTRIESSSALLAQLEASQARAEDLDAARLAALKEYETQVAAAQNAVSALQRDAAEQINSLSIEIEAQKKLRLREVRDLRAQLDSATKSAIHEQKMRLEAVKSLSDQIEAEQTLRERVVRELHVQLESTSKSAIHEQQIRLEAVEELTRQVHEQTLEAARWRTHSDELQEQMSALSIGMDMMTAQAARSEVDLNQAKRQIIELYAGLGELDETVGAMEQYVLAEAVPPMDELPGLDDSQYVTSALSALQRRARILSEELQTRCEMAPITPPMAVEFADETITASSTPIRELENRNAELQTEIERIRSSLSWRILGPLRIAVRKVRGLGSGI